MFYFENGCSEMLALCVHYVAHVKLIFLFFYIIAPPPPDAISVLHAGALYSQPTGEVIINVRLNPPARYNITATVESRCLDAGCNSVNIPQCQNNISRKRLCSTKIN